VLLGLLILGLKLSPQTLALIALCLSVAQQSINFWKLIKGFLEKRARRLERLVGIHALPPEHPKTERSITVAEIDKIVLKPKA